MLIDNVELCSDNLARRIPLAFRDPDSSLSYQVKSIIGLDADEILARYIGNPNGEADDIYRMPTVTKREVVLSLGLNPWLDPLTTYSSLREEVYKIISGSAGGSVKLYFNLGDTTIAALTGFITKIEATHFAKTPELQITIDCSKEPLLKAVTRTILDVHGLMVGRYLTIHDDLSTAMHGCKFVVKMHDDTSSFGIIGDGGWGFSVSYPFHANDELHIYSETDAKAVYRVRSGVAKHLADKIGANSIWPLMLPGRNGYILSGGISLMSFSYVNTYLGV